MTSSLEIDGKKMLSIKSAASETSYSRDYITRLAREQKIVAAQISRQWFVDLASLKHYSEISDIEQKIRQRHLSDERKRERLLKEVVEEKAVERKKETRAMSMRAGAVASLVLTLGLSVGFALQYVPLVSSSYSKQVASASLIQQFGWGEKETAASKRPAAPAPEKAMATAEMVNFSHESVRLSTLADVSEGILLLPHATSGEPINATEYFSDDVTLLTDEYGQQFVARVDEKGTVIEKIPFVVVPVNNEKTP